MEDVCGMLPFATPGRPDQFYRLYTSLFLNAGFVHLIIVVSIQLFVMRDLEKLVGSLRLSVIYFGSGIIGNLASSIFVPYRAEVGPSGALFGVLATFIMEVIKAWEVLRNPWLALAQMFGIMGIMIIFGLVPWVDNYAHTFGFLAGLLLSYALLPELEKFPIIAGGGGGERTHRDTRKNLLKSGLAVAVTIAIFCILMAIFYSVAFDCTVCKILSCVPIFSDFCAEQNIDFETTPRVLF
jgi:membrane associated rhomboid family serine protease